MKRFMIAAVAAAFAFQLVPAGATHGVNYSITRRIEFPTALTGGDIATKCFRDASDGNLFDYEGNQDDECGKSTVTRHHRCLYLTAEDQAQSATAGKFGFTVPISAALDGHAFRLESSSAVDFDIIFFKTLGTCSNEVGAAGVVITGEDPNQEFAPGAEYSFTKVQTTGPASNTALRESGTIPVGARFAIVALFGARDATFRLEVDA